MANTIIAVENIMKSYSVGTQDVPVLKGISFDVVEGDFLVIFGPSGSGKSTLLHTMLGLEPPTSGKIRFFNTDLYQNSTEDDRAIFRKQHIGMVYQQPNWIKALNVAENIVFPLLLLGKDKESSMVKALEALKQIQMSDWAYYFPTELSSGQQQRIAFARALIANPEVIIADEPTGNLDFESGQYMMELLSSINKNGKKTVIMVTHDLEYLKYAKTGVKILDGKLAELYSGKNIEKITKEIQSKRGERLEEQQKPLRSKKDEKSEELVKKENSKS